MFYVYILESQTRKNFHYVGLNDDLQQRLSCHNHGLVLSTKAFRPYEMVWYCAFPTKHQAAQFEQYLKGGSGRAFAKRHLLL